MSRIASRFLVVVMATLLATGWLTARPLPAQAVPSPDVVISQVYGGGGNSGATYNRKFVELFNRGASAVSLNGKSLQYASATGTGNFGIANQILVLPNVSIPAGGYYLVGLAIGANGAVLPAAPDLDASTGFASNPAAASGKLIVANTTTTLGCNGGSSACSAAQLAQIIDLVGYGTANFFEGAGAAPALSATTAGFRGGAGCTDTDDNGSDFTAATPAPRNTSTPLNPCGGGTTLSINDVSLSEGNAGTTTFQFTVSLSAPTGSGGVTFNITTADNSATIADNDYVSKSLTGQTIAEGQTTYQFEVIVNGDTAVEPDETFFVNVTGVTGANVSDGQGQGTLTNDDVATNPCDDAFTPIYQIQGSGSATTIPGNVVTEGVVVGDFEGIAANSGFFIQDPVGDGNPATSDGIFVFTGATDLASVGQLVRVTGFARERFNQTAINGSNSNTSPVTMVVNCGTGSVTATDVNMPFAAPVGGLSFQERYEGMSVRFPQPLVIAEYFNYGRFGEMVLALPLEGETRPFTGTAIDEPGAPANARTLANSLRRITLDDNQSAQNPPALRHPNGAAFALDNLFRGGDKVQNAVGVLAFDFSLYRIFPTAGADYTAVNGRPPAPEPVGGSLTVAAMNTLNFFLTLDATAGDSGPCGGDQNLDCRGADANADPPLDPIVDLEFPRQRDKLLEALAGLDADVLGLNEIENTPGVDPLGDPDVGIVAGLNETLGEGTYAAIDTGPIGTDAIKVGLIYKPGVVTPVGDFQVLDSTDDPRFIDTRSRPALAQTFEEIATGARFTVVVNHLKSKGSACAGDPDAGDGQGNCNGTRTLAAQALVDWIATDPTGAGDPDFLIMGDLNSYAKEDPIDAIKAGSDDAAGTADDWTNLIEQHVGTFAYSFVFDGQSGYLDHALANASIAGQVVDADEWHINADEPSVLDYDVSFKPEAQDRLYEVDQFRTSDHDPVLVGLNLVNEAPTIAVTAGLSCNGSTNGGSFALAVDDNEVAAGNLTVSLTGNTNTTLVPNGNVVFGGSGASRTVGITAASGRTGTAVLTIGVNDGFQTVTTTINVRILGSGNDVFVGTAGADLITGGQGNDDLSGLDGPNVLCGGQGNNTLTSGSGNDALDGGTGNDSLSSGGGNDLVLGGTGNDTVAAGSGDDVVSGGDGDDVLDVAEGNDTVFGGTGNDTLSGGDGDDSLSGGEGNDSLRGQAGDDTLTGGLGGDFFSGGPDTDTNTDFNPPQGDTWDGT